MAARSAVRLWEAGGAFSRIPTAVYTTPFSRDSPFPLSAFFSPRRHFSSGTHTATGHLYGHAHSSFAFSAPRRAAPPAREHHESHQIIPRYTDDIPAEFYKYGAFKNFKNDSTTVPCLARSGAIIGITLALCILNVKWSSEHWHYKHRLAGSYLESE